jgi:membrane fusion protein (multidrug efflux system)
VQSQEFAQEIEALGTARAKEAVEITAKVSNIVTAIRFDEGQRVTAGQVLVELDAAQVRADLAAAEAALVESRAQAERSRALSASAALSKAQVDQIEATLKANEARVAAAKARLADTVIRAPFGGRTGLRRVSLGSLVSPGSVITTLDDTSTIKLDFAVPESFVSLMSTGLPIGATSVAYPGVTFEGRVASIDSRVDPQTRSVLVRAEVPNGDGRLKPGMFMGVRLQREVPPTLMLPEAAVVPDQGRTFVYVVEDGKAERREVALGRRRPGEVEVVTGLRANERVVVEGTQKLRDGAAVREAGEPARPAGGPAQGAGARAS